MCVCLCVHVCIYVYMCVCIYTLACLHPFSQCLSPPGGEHLASLRPFLSRLDVKATEVASRLDSQDGPGLINRGWLENPLSLPMKFGKIIGKS